MTPCFSAPFLIGLYGKGGVNKGKDNCKLTIIGGCRVLRHPFYAYISAHFSNFEERVRA